MGGLVTPAYGDVYYLLFLVIVLCVIGFVGDFLVPASFDRGLAVTTWIIDIVLLGLFAVQHSGMARCGFKRWLRGGPPEPLERSTDVLLPSLVLILMFWQWRPCVPNARAHDLSVAAGAPCDRPQQIGG